MFGAGHGILVVPHCSLGATLRGRTFCYNDIFTVTVIQMTVTVIKVIVTPIDHSNYLDTLDNSQSIHSLCRKVCTKSDLAICCEQGLFLMGFFKGRIRNGP